MKPTLITVAIALVSLLVIVSLSLVILSLKQKQDVSRIERRIERTLQPDATRQRFNEALIAGLPAPVQRYFRHAIAPETPIPGSVRLTMHGQFRLAQDQPWLPMRAQEILSADGFVWKATIGQGLSQFQGADYYLHRSGRMQFSLLGLVPIVNVHNANTARSAIGRLAAELMWLPSALLPQQGVEWSVIDDRTIQAQLQIDDEPVTLTLVIDGDGKLLESYALRWGDRTKDGSWVYIPMGGKCYAERSFGGFTIPSQTRAGWWFGTEQYFEFFQNTIEQAEF
jgi:hypothetical protein